MLGPIPEHMVVKSKIKEVWDMFTEDKTWIKVRFNRISLLSRTMEDLS
jgi:hypothetical protein